MIEMHPLNFISASRTWLDLNSTKPTHAGEDDANGKNFVVQEALDDVSGGVPCHYLAIGVSPYILQSSLHSNRRLWIA